MYTLYTDKSENFKCSIDVEGATIDRTTARLVLENDNMNVLFEGVINSDGSCVIPIKKMKHILPEGTKGTMKLEVVADDTFFSPWQDDFTIKVNKKVTVEVANDTRINRIKENKVKVQVTNVKQKTKKKPIQREIVKTKKSNHTKIMAGVLRKKGITLDNFNEKLNTTIPLVSAYVKKFKVGKSADDLLNEIIFNL
jgi:hypothetical protein